MDAARADAPGRPGPPVAGAAGFALLLALHVAAVWAHPRFPSQDGPSHVYNARVLADLGDPANWVLRDVFQRNLAVFPNWAAHGLLRLFLELLPPDAAEKLLVSLCVALLPVGFALLVRALHGGFTPFVWLGFPASLSLFLHLGFYSFVLGVAALLFTLAWWWPRRAALGPGGVAALGALSVATYACHALPFALGLLALPLLGLAGGIGARRLLVLAGALLPAAVLLLQDALARLPLVRAAVWPPPSWSFDYLLGSQSLVSFTHVDRLPAYGVTAALALGLVATLVARARARPLVRPRDALLPFLGASLFLFFALPSAVTDQSWIGDRVHFVLLLGTAAWLGPAPGRASGRALAVLALLCALGQLALASWAWRGLNRDLAAFAAAEGRLEPHATFTVRCPDWNLSDELGRVQAANPFLHAACRYGLARRDLAYLSNYEANLPWFPVRFRGEWEGPVDYVIAWHPEQDAGLARLDERYETVHESPRLKVYRRRRAPRPLSPPVRFDFGPADAAAPAGWLRVPPDGGGDGWGWVTRAPRHAGGVRTAAPDPSGDFVSGVADAAFAVELPDGRWRATALFRSTDGARHDLALFAGDAAIVPRARVRPEDGAVERAAVVEARGGRVVFVIHSGRAVAREGLHDHWIWSGLTIEGDGR
jgi:hypothetical protein